MKDEDNAEPSVHSATLGKGKSDDTLSKIKGGDLKGKGEVTLVFGKQDTHVDRAGRTLIRDTFDDAGLTMSVSNLESGLSNPRGEQLGKDSDDSSWRSKRSMRSSETSRARGAGTPLLAGVFSR